MKVHLSFYENPIGYNLQVTTTYSKLPISIVGTGAEIGNYNGIEYRKRKNIIPMSRLYFNILSLEILKFCFNSEEKQRDRVL